MCAFFNMGLCWFLCKAGWPSKWLAVASDGVCWLCRAIVILLSNGFLYLALGSMRNRRCIARRSFVYSDRRDVGPIFYLVNECWRIYTIIKEGKYKSDNNVIICRMKVRRVCTPASGYLRRLWMDFHAFFVIFYFTRFALWKITVDFQINRKKRTYEIIAKYSRNIHLACNCLMRMNANRQKRASKSVSCVCLERLARDFCVPASTKSYSIFHKKSTFYTFSGLGGVYVLDKRE